MYKGKVQRQWGKNTPSKKTNTIRFFFPQKVCAHFFGGRVRGGPFFSTPQFHTNSLVQFCGCVEAAFRLNRGSGVK